MGRQPEASNGFASQGAGDPRHVGFRLSPDAQVLEADPFGVRLDSEERAPPGGGVAARSPRETGFRAAALEGDFADVSRRVRLAAKATVFEEGAPAEAVWSLVSGTVLLSKLLHDGRRQIVGIALPGDFLGLPMQPSNSFTACALTPAMLCRCEQSRFAALLESSPCLMRQAFTGCFNELRLAQDHMLLLGRRSAQEKVAAFILCLHARWALLRGLSARVDLPMTRQDIGDYLCLTLETVSRSMTKLAQRKIIAIIPDGVRILDMDRLKAVAGF